MPKQSPLGKGFQEIIEGNNAGTYPGLDRVFASEFKDYGGKVNNRRMPYADTICNDDCPYRQRGQQQVRQEGELILDVRPPAGERLAVLEHRVTELKECFDDHRTESIRAGSTYATKEELQVVDDHVNTLVTQGNFKTIALIFSVIVGLLSLAYNAINLYKVFHI